MIGVQNNNVVQWPATENGDSIAKRLRQHFGAKICAAPVIEIYFFIFQIFNFIKKIVKNFYFEGTKKDMLQSCRSQLQCQPMHAGCADSSEAMQQKLNIKYSK